MTTGRIDQIIITLIERRIMDSWSTMMNRRDFNFIYPACFHSHCAVQLWRITARTIDFIFQWISIPTTNQVTFYVLSDFTSLTKLTLGPVIKFNQVNESMNQSMTNSTQLNFKNQVKIKLQVKLQAQTTTSKLNSQSWAGPSNFNYQTYQLNFNLTTCLQPSLSLRFQNQLKLSYSFTHSLTPQLIQTFKPT